MASLRKHPRSKFWYLRRRNLDTGKWEESSTNLRHDDEAETRKALRLRDAASNDERRVGVSRKSPAFIHWVPGYIESHYANKSPATRRRMQTAWQALRVFMAGQSIIYPRQVRYAHGAEYIAWRADHHVHDQRRTGHNTALLEIKFLSQLMNEAVRREYVETNTLARLGIGKAAQKAKPELTDADIAALNTAFKNKPEWMRVAFAISLYTGCRFNECSIPLENVDFERGTIRLRDSKRKENDPRKFFSVPMDINLRSVLEPIRKRGDSFTVEATRFKNWQINRVFKEVANATFHSLRVTFVTRCHRAGVSLEEAMRLVNHSSQLIHRVYSRLNVDDVKAARAKVVLPSLD